MFCFFVVGYLDDKKFALSWLNPFFGTIDNN